MTGMLHQPAMAYLTPGVLAELKRQVAIAEQCPSCLNHPVPVVRNGVPVVYTAHPPECRGERPVLTVVEGGAS